MVGPKFISSLKELCGADACIPKGFPSTALRKCQNIEELDCSYAVLRNSYVSLQREENTLPCDDLGYTGTYITDILETSVFSDEFLWKDNLYENASRFFVWYVFEAPETTTLNEEYYTVPIYDLIGLIGGTLGIFIGFSFYGAISALLALIVSLVLKTGRLSFEVYF